MPDDEKNEWQLLDEIGKDISKALSAYSPNNREVFLVEAKAKVNQLKSLLIQKSRKGE